MPRQWLPLLQLAKSYGVQSSYRATDGRLTHASPTALLAVLESLGAPVASIKDVPGAIRQRREELAQHSLEPCSVLWSGQIAKVSWRSQETAEGPVRVQLELEDGSQREATIQAEWTQQSSGRQGGYLTLPWTLPQGYHRIFAHSHRRQEEGLLIVAPKQAQVPAAGRMWGVFSPLYALHSPTSWGIGDLDDLQQLMQWVGRQGGDVVGTLPLLATFLEQPFDPSPYAPISRLFWNELFLALHQLPEMSEWEGSNSGLLLAELSQLQDELNRHCLVDYRKAMQLKRQVLEPLSQVIERLPSRRQLLENWLSHYPQARTYARFRAAVERNRGQFPPSSLTEHSGDVQRERYHLYVQWAMDEQLAALSAQHVGLYLDFPLGVHPDGYDRWRYGEQFAVSSTGAPPDDFFQGGQNWGFPPPHPQRSREHGHSYFIACLRHHLQYARVLRLDHAASLMRLFWIPAGMTPADGVYVQYPTEELYAILCLESQRSGTMLVGEDLGTLPPGLGRGLSQRKIQRMYVLPAAGGKRNRRLPVLPRGRLACLNTHDMPTFAGFHQELSQPERWRWQQLVGAKQPTMRRTLAAAWQRLAASRARLFIINLEDLWGEPQAQNRPGTNSHQHPNWRRKVALSLPSIVTHPLYRGWLQRLDRLRHGQR